MTYKEICGSENCVWFEMGERNIDKIRFLKWAKSSGCVWADESKIKPLQKIAAPYLAIHGNGAVYRVNMWAWLGWWHTDESERTKVISFDEWRKMIGK